MSYIMEKTGKTINGGKPCALIRGMSKLCEVFCVILLAVIFIVTTLQVIARTFSFSDALIWSDELTRYLTIWLVMFSTGLAVLKRSHASIDIFTRKSGPKIKKALTAISDFLIVFMLCYATYGTFEMCVKFNKTLSVAMKLPMGVVYIGMLIGWAFCDIIGIYNLISDFNATGGESE